LASFGAGSASRQLFAACVTRLGTRGFHIPTGGRGGHCIPVRPPRIPSIFKRPENLCRRTSLKTRALSRPIASPIPGVSLLIPGLATGGGPIFPLAGPLTMDSVDSPGRKGLIQMKIPGGKRIPVFLSLKHIREPPVISGKALGIFHWFRGRKLR